MLGIMLQSDNIGLLFINFQFQWTNNIKPTHTVGNHNQIQSTADNVPLSLSPLLCSAPATSYCRCHWIWIMFPRRETSNTWKWIYCIVIIVVSCQCCCSALNLNILFHPHRMLTWEQGISPIQAFIYVCILNCFKALKQLILSVNFGFNFPLILFGVDFSIIFCQSHFVTSSTKLMRGFKYFFKLNHAI